MRDLIGFIATLIVGGLVFTVVGTALYVLVAYIGEASAFAAGQVHNPLNRKKHK